jgi:hypothetical protein
MILRPTCWLLAAVFSGSLATPCLAQEPPDRRPSGAAAFGIEAAGGIAGSAVGFGTVALLTADDACGDDLTCILGNAALALSAATVGAALGTYASGRAFDTRPSGAGAIVGALIGVVAGVGMEHLLREEVGLNMSDRASVATLAVTQGALTALASRAGAALRDR